MNRYATASTARTRRGIRLAGSTCRFLTILMIPACSFNYDDAQLDSKRAEDVPQIELFGVSMEVSRENRLELTADHIATFPERNVQEMDRVVFREFGPDGTLRVEGQSDSAILYLDTENVLLKGSIRFVSSVEDAQVESEYLFWDSDQRVLTAEDEPVFLSRSDGSYINGTGMVLDGRRNSVRFTGGVTGSYIVGQEDR